jgi:hypothetical protein
MVLPHRKRATDLLDNHDRGARFRTSFNEFGAEIEVITIAIVPQYRKRATRVLITNLCVPAFDPHKSDQLGDN